MRRLTRFRGVLLAVIISMSAGTARADLVAHWLLDEPTNTSGIDSIRDSGPSSRHHGTPDVPPDAPVTFGVEGVTADSGTAASFNLGSIDVPFDPELNPESFTFCVWAKAYSTGPIPGYQSVVTSRLDTFPDLFGFILYNDPGGNWNFWTGTSGGWAQLSGGAVVVDEWTHLAISFDAMSGTKTIHVNGVPTSAFQQYAPNTVQDLHLGAGGDLGTQYYFDGALDDAALWDVALLDDEIIAIMEEGVSAVLDDLVAHWELDEEAGTTGPGSVVDLIGGHDGGLPPPPFVPGTPGANGNTGTSITFSNASVNVPFDPDLNPPSFTLTVWAWPEETTGFQSVVTNRNDVGPGQAPEGFILYNDNGGRWAFWTGDGDPNWPSVPGLAVVTGVWQHLAISFDAATNTKKLYVDGFGVGSATDQGYVPNVLKDLHIGGGGDLGDEFRFRGAIDDVGLWNEALSEAEIQGVLENGVASWEPTIVPAPTGLAAVADGLRVDLTFESPAGTAGVDWDAIEVRRDGASIATLAAEVTSYTDESLAEEGNYCYRVFAKLGAASSPGTEEVCVDVTDVGGPGFIRGDTNADGARNITDGVFVFSFLFTGGQEPPCKDAADTSDQGSINITSGIYILNFLFLGGPEPPAPFPACGTDPTPEGTELGCEFFPPCEP